MGDGIFELLKFSKASQESDHEYEAEEFLEKMIKTFLDGLNDDSQYESDSYGGEIEHGFHPSAICGAICARKLCYEYSKVPAKQNRISADLRRIFDNGSSMHDRWQMYFTLMSNKYPDKIKLLGTWKCKGCSYIVGDGKSEFPKDAECPQCKSKRWKYNEFRLKSEELMIVGKSDGKIVMVEQGRTLLLEFKSCGSFMFNGLHAPMEKHKKQFCFYMLMDGTHEGLFLYENKDTQAIKPFYMKYDENIIADELKLVKMAVLNIKAGTLPDRIKTYPHSKNCKKCEYRDFCAI